MNNSPLISVIIIFLNEERFLRAAIDSVFQQTLTSWEIILVDDGSKDGSPAIAKEFATRYPERVRYYTHPNGENRGMSASRNLGIQHACGEFLSFLDADDIYLPELLERQAGILQNHPDVGMVCGNTKYWFRWNQDVQSQADFVPRLGVAPEKTYAPPRLLPYFLTGKAAVPHSFLVRHSACTRASGFDNEFRGLYEDQVFLAKICLQENIYMTADCLELYRQHPKSISAVSGWMQETKARIRFLNWLEEYMQAQGLKDRAVAAAIARERWLLSYPRWLPAHLYLHRTVRWLKKWAVRIQEWAAPARRTEE